MTDQERAKDWMESVRRAWDREFGPAENAREYMVMDCNYQLGTNLPETELRRIALEVMP